MENIVLYCKTFRGDFERVKILYESINKYNIELIPFYISVPKSDHSLFSSYFPLDMILIDEEIMSQSDLHNRGVNLGRVVNHIRLNIFKTQLSKNYFCLDSDSYFIRNFYKKDFLYKSDIPYTVCHEQKDLFEFYSANKDLFPNNIKENWKDKVKKVKETFQTEGKFFDFGPNPVLWNHKVLESLFNEYLKPNNLTAEDITSYAPVEYVWYGEYLLSTSIIPFIPCGPFFKVYHYEMQYLEDLNKNITDSILSENYLGVIKQSNWCRDKNGKLK